MHMKKAIVLMVIAGGLLLNPLSVASAYDRYGGYQDRGDAYDRYDDDGDYTHDMMQERALRRETDSGEDGMVVLVVFGLLAVYGLSRSFRGKTRPSRFSGGGGYDSTTGMERYTRQEEPPARQSYSDPSAGHFWGNDVDGTRVKSLWGTTKEE